MQHVFHKKISSCKDQSVNTAQNLIATSSSFSEHAFSPSNNCHAPVLADGGVCGLVLRLCCHGAQD
jgi:hypothetical protein